MDKKNNLERVVKYRTRATSSLKPSFWWTCKQHLTMYKPWSVDKTETWGKGDPEQDAVQAWSEYLTEPQLTDPSSPEYIPPYTLDVFLKQFKVRNVTEKDPLVSMPPSDDEGEAPTAEEAALQRACAVEFEPDNKKSGSQL